jgi:hypothetical protein
VVADGSVTITSVCRPKIAGAITNKVEVSGSDIEVNTENNSAVTAVLIVERDESARRFRRGDCNDDGHVNISDPVCILNWLFVGGSTPASGCIAVANTNGDGKGDISDAVYLLRFLFLGGPLPVPPFPNCGPMPDDEALSCATPPETCPQ